MVNVPKSQPTGGWHPQDNDPCARSTSPLPLLKISLSVTSGELIDVIDETWMIVLLKEKSASTASI